MSKYIVELRKNESGSTEADEPEAFLALVTRDDSERFGANRGKNSAFVFDTEGQARNEINRLPDEFFDRYWPTIVPHK